MRARQAAEVRQGPRRALCAAGLHISTPPVASPRRCGRPRHGLPDPRLRPPNWRRYISTLAALIELDLGPCACFVQRFTRVRAAGGKPVGSSRCGLDARTRGCRMEVARPEPPHSTPSVWRRECSPLSHGYMPGCGLTMSIASLVGPAQSGPPGEPGILSYARHALTGAGRPRMHERRARACADASVRLRA